MTPAFNWFNDAMRCTRSRARYVDLLNYKKKLKPGRRPNPTYLAGAVKAMQKDVKTLKTGEWRNWLESLAAKTEKLW